MKINLYISAICLLFIQYSFAYQCPDNTRSYGGHGYNFYSGDSAITLYNANDSQQKMIDNTLKHLSFVEIEALPAIIVADGSNEFLSTPTFRGESFFCSQKKFSWIKLSPASFKHSGNQDIYKSLLREVGKFVYFLYLKNDMIFDEDYAKLDTYMDNYLAANADDGFSSTSYEEGFAEAYMNYQASKIKLGNAKPNGTKLNQDMINFFTICEEESTFITDLEVIGGPSENYIDDESTGFECSGVLDYGELRDSPAEIKQKAQLDPFVQDVAECISDYFPGITRVGGFMQRCTKTGPYSSKAEAYKKTDGTCEGCGSISDHAHGLAIDAFVTPIILSGKDKGYPKSRSQAWDTSDEEYISGELLFLWLLDYRIDLGISTLIWNKRIYSITNDWKGAKYSGSNPHFNHVHISFNSN